jgi:hypothetical protein
MRFISPHAIHERTQNISGSQPSRHGFQSVKHIVHGLGQRGMYSVDIGNNSKFIIDQLSVNHKGYSITVQYIFVRFTIVTDHSKNEVG